MLPQALTVVSCCLVTCGLTLQLLAQERPPRPSKASFPIAPQDGPSWALIDPDGRGVAHYEKYIRPLFAQRCYQCHSERAGKSEGGLSLDQRAGWLQGGERGPSVLPGDVAASLLVQAVRFAAPDLQMPPSEPLSAQEIQQIEQWVRMGAPGPREGAEVESLDPSDPVAGKAHWAFQRLKRPQLPRVRGTSWPRGAIDQFVLAKLEQSGLQPVPDASPRQLLRRISLQLTGLPPTLSDAFADGGQREATHDEPERWTQHVQVCVEQALATPQFGQRWGRHWLDLARFADSNGLDENFLFREAWRYRNWVIDAVNADTAYDRFLVEQLAGDLLPFDTIAQRDSQRIAAGFLVIGPKVLLGVKAGLQRMDVADEQIESVGRTVLGQTLGCARCHDHKFDPIPTEDYYALAGIFTSTRVMETRYMLGEQRLMEQLIGLGEKGDEADESYEVYWRGAPALRVKKEHADRALTSLQNDKLEEFAAVRDQQPDAIAESASNEGLTLAERVAAQQQLVEEINKNLAHPPAIPPRAMIPNDVEEPADEAIRLAGQFDALGERVPRGFLTVLSERSSAIEADQSGRLALAQWLTDTEQGAGHVAARVLANRIWHHMIGRGLVRTVDNFGRTGETSTHPELLDYLACELIDSGWSVKHLVRQIALSRTFALSSRFDAANDAIDPDNRFLWRGHRRRLEPEVIRDAILVAAGQLDDRQFGSTVDYLGDQATAVGSNPVRRRTNFPCRSVYLPVIRNDLPEIFDAFDFTNPHTTTGARPQTIVPSQSLFMLNDEFVMDSAEQTAQRIMAESPTTDLTSRVELLFALLTYDTPSLDERDAVLAFLQPSTNGYLQSRTAEEGRREQESPDGSSHQATGVEEAELHALALACHALFASSRFQFIE